MMEVYKTSDNLLAHANDMMKSNPTLGYELRAVHCMRKQAHWITRIRPRPTGSRFYSDYWTKSSDWDFYIPVPCKPAHRELVDAGWRQHSTDYGGTSFYRGTVNLLVPATPAEAVHILMSTLQCKRENPCTRRAAIRIWKNCRAFVQDSDELIETYLSENKNNESQSVKLQRVAKAFLLLMK